MSARRVVLCADDFGFSPGISRGILELLEKGRISATSCMVNHPEFRDDAPALKPFIGRADIGLHFSLTDTRSIASVAVECHLRPPQLSAMKDEIERQVERFADALGVLPEYIDGHQHVHVLPVIRNAVVHVARRIGAYVRVPRDRVNFAMWRRPAPLESAYLSLASRSISKLADAAGVSTNRGFRGVRTFREKLSFDELFPKMIAGAGDACLIMCHPGYVDATLASRDSVLEPRADELNYLSGPQFPVDMAQAGLTLNRLREISPPLQSAQ